MSIGKMGFWSVFAVGVGGMVGGIFPVLGLAVELTHKGAPLAFAIAGMVALITTYAYAKLSVAYPSRGGTVPFLTQAFGTGLVSGSLNLLLWLSYVVMLSLYFSAFGSYGASLFPESFQSFWKHFLISITVVGISGLNLLSADIVGKAQKWIVGFKLGILLLFIAIGIWQIDFPQIEATGTSLLPMVSGGMIIFLSYEGFELIANTAEDVINPRQMPLAYYSAVVFVIVLYVLIALVAVGTLPVENIVAARDYALARVASPVMGEFGVISMTIAALLSTTSAINATFYGSARLSYVIAQSKNQLHVLEKEVINKQHLGLFIISGLTLIFANFFDLSRISTMGSAGFLLIFAAVNLANVRLYRQTQNCRWISLLGACLCVAALIVLCAQTARTDPQALWVMAILLALAIGLDVIYCLFTNCELRL
ncbi:APC family permease [Nostocaceae cyanobacterium CENA369]|uniref:APC family permease n=1 Tax=Dendronalium phyllosphericum CENA369 TaxID=1725256 RepID=A0A8J7IDK3_9NOST|nr:APC family permease [Dendronalium phyllosphericum]MBH8577493.1 APC family permease [Dendronalium phyllosphericum CENA369]